MVGADFQRSTQLSDSFFHPRDSHSRSPSGRHATQLLRWDTLALVFYLNDNLMVGAMKANFRRRTSRMPMNVRKTFLHKPKNCGFHLAWYSTEIIRAVKIDADLAPPCESLGIPGEG